MGIRTLARAGIIGTAALALASLPAAAQTVTFSTSGAFSGGSCAALTSCTFGGFTLSYVNAPSANWLAPTDVDLGDFSVLCGGAPCTPGSSAAILAGSTFTLTITQTAPSGGTAMFTGTLSGTLNWNPSGSSLFWTPNQGSVVIGSVTYALIEQDQGGGVLGINIAAPTPATGQNPNTTIVKAHITATPEPATLLLMGTGFLGLIPVVRRRRQN